MTDIRQVFKDAMTYLSWKDSLYIDFVLVTKVIDAPNLSAPMGIRATNRELELFVNYPKLEQYNLNKEDIYQILKHEYAHVLLKHLFSKLPDYNVDNIAADMEINQSPWTDLTDNVKKWCVLHSKFKLPAQKSREWYYNELMKQPFKSTPGNNNQKLDEHFFDDNNDAVEQVWSGIVEKVLNNAKLKGTLSNDIIEQILARWKQHPSLKQILKRIIGKYYAQSIVEGQSKLRPNRRFPLLPGNVDRFGPKIVFAIDTSGSMSSKDLEDIYSVIRWVQKKMSILVIQCDCDIKDISSKIKTQINVKGRGGTSFIPVFNYIHDKLKDKIDLLVYATDLYGDFPTEKPRYPVIWLATEDKQVPFGKIIKLNS